ncbi:MAG: PorV/PorQ family protein [Bacteroidetes bacterium]|nr:PorV/PorQ family protein [Bacteroidota bacterium]
MKTILNALLIVAATGLVVSQPVQAQSITRAGTTAAPFLKIGVDARSNAMGQAMVSLANDPAGLFWNPATIAYTEKIQAVVSHYDYVADLYMEYDAVAIPIEGLGVLGLSVTYLGMPDIERTTVSLPGGTGEKVSASSLAVGATWASALTDRFAIGGSLKYIRETLWHSYASSVAGDVGLTYTTLNDRFRLGMSISHFGPDMQMSGRDMRIQHDINPGHNGNNPSIIGFLAAEKFPLPVLFRVGVSSDLTSFITESKAVKWVVAADAVHPNDDYEHVNLGSEVTISDMVALRAGYNRMFDPDEEGGLGLGIGFSYNLMGIGMRLDYANVDFGYLDRQNQFTLVLTF